MFLIEQKKKELTVIVFCGTPLLRTITEQHRFHVRYFPHHGGSCSLLYAISPSVGHNKLESVNGFSAIGCHTHTVPTTFPG